jgi:hypothetical protein
MVAANYDVLDVTCVHCGITYQILANLEDVEAWMSGSAYIQDVLVYLSPAERELLISGTCDNCWKNMFPPELDVDSDEE